MQVVLLLDYLRFFERTSSGHRAALPIPNNKFRCDTLWSVLSLNVCMPTHGCSTAARLADSYFRSVAQQYTRAPVTRLLAHFASPISMSCLVRCDVYHVDAVGVQVFLFTFFPACFVVISRIRAFYPL